MTAPLRFAYGTNGLADNRLPEAVDLLADLGYDGVALTLDVHHLDPFSPTSDADVQRVAQQLRARGLAVVVETGGRYVLDPRRKHRPTLLDEDPRLRREFLQRAVEIAANLGASVVSFWSGSLPAGTAPATAWARLTEEVAGLLPHAEMHGVRLGFEPEPGMLVDRITGFERLAAELGDPAGLGITLDLGHCLCIEDDPVVDCVRRVAGRLVNVQIEDMRRGVHEHLPFGEGELDVPPVLAALREVGYSGLVGVELPRHSHAGPDLAEASIRFLRSAEERAGATRGVA
ncbi:sugar phosphate isomerase/epimerase family protein [Blastococcus capsensis]|uniref:sugar phosphate isomerase/epimerase family protein n=1 Tax=Blastococcus capsensis TaxID=1564163 RepID=UPI00254118B9|nr:sugar phosphate isomerase/epimerase family protein [Blastococcus capsensis]MDK3256795.1 sugar phosphate isomerase/epimerase family protein [Blastococcus capsensis]